MQNNVLLTEIYHKSLPHKRYKSKECGNLDLEGMLTISCAKKQGG